jgi:hypothetical protein
MTNKRISTLLFELYKELEKASSPLVPIFNDGLPLNRINDLFKSVLSSMV